jgi:hypothetical protein
MAGKVAPNIVTNGLVLYLDAANPESYVSGSTAWNDISRGGNNGTLVNGPTFNSENGGSIVFDGVNDYITGSNNISISQTQPFTLEFWSNISAYSPANQAFCQLKTDTTYGFTVFASQNINYSGITFGSTNTWIKLKNSNIPILTNTWYNIAITYNGSSAEISSNYRMYLNTQQQVLNNAGSLINLSQINNIGTIENGSRGIDNLNGRISLFKIYNRALSAEEILQNYNATKTRFGL